MPLNAGQNGDNGKKTKGTRRIFVCSIYFPVTCNEYREFLKELNILMEKIPEKCDVFIGHDINANIGTRQNGDEYKQVIGPFGLNNRNTKGKSLLRFLNSHNLRFANSFFEKKSYTTWASPSASRSKHTLDGWSVSTTAWKMIRDCDISKYGVPSDHSLVIMKVHMSSIKFNPQKRKEREELDREGMLCEVEMNQNFNDRLDILKGKDPTFSAFFAAAKTAANQTCMKSQYKSKPWFEYSKDALQPFVNEQ